LGHDISKIETIGKLSQSKLKQLKLEQNRTKYNNTTIYVVTCAATSFSDASDENEVELDKIYIYVVSQSDFISMSVRLCQ